MCLVSFFKFSSYLIWNFKYLICLFIIVILSVEFYKCFELPNANITNSRRSQSDEPTWVLDVVNPAAAPLNFFYDRSALFFVFKSIPPLSTNHYASIAFDGGINFRESGLWFPKERWRRMFSPPPSSPPTAVFCYYLLEREGNVRHSSKAAGDYWSCWRGRGARVTLGSCCPISCL